MRYLPLLALVAACGDDGHGGNPAKLWLATDGSEVNLKLQENQPAPF
jgi:hypothetical protein